MLGVLAEEGLEGRHQSVHVQAPAGIHVPCRFLLELLLHHPRQFARHHLGVDRVGHARRTILGNQTQIPRVLQVAVGKAALFAAAQQRLDHPPHPLLLELVGQLIQMCLAAKDQLLLGVADGPGFHRMAPVPSNLALEAGLVGQGVDKPRLAPGLFPDRLQRVVGEHLARLRRVLRQQGPRLPGAEIAQPQRFGLDVEGAAPGDHRILGGRLDPVVAHIPHSAQGPRSAENLSGRRS